MSEKQVISTKPTSVSFKTSWREKPWPEVLTREVLLLVALVIATIDLVRVVGAVFHAIALVLAQDALAVGGALERRRHVAGHDHLVEAQIGQTRGRGHAPSGGQQNRGYGRRRRRNSEGGRHRSRKGPELRVMQTIPAKNLLFEIKV